MGVYLGFNFRVTSLPSKNTKICTTRKFPSIRYTLLKMVAWKRCKTIMSCHGNYNELCIAISRLYLPSQVGSLLSQVWSSKHVLVAGPNRSKLLSQENVATTPTLYSPFGRAAGSYEMSPSAGEINGGQVAMHEQV